MTESSSFEFESVILTTLFVAARNLVMLAFQIDFTIRNLLCINIIKGLLSKLYSDVGWLME